MSNIVSIVYTNWQGETRTRVITPSRIWFGTTPWHTEPQWLLQAMDMDNGDERDFAMKDIKSWSNG